VQTVTCGPSDEFWDAEQLESKKLGTVFLLDYNYRQREKSFILKSQYIAEDIVEMSTGVYASN
jgi:hypothetical protein